MSNQTNIEANIANIEKIQELMRILDATLSEVNPDGLFNGFNAMNIIRFLCQFPNMSVYAGKDF